MRVDFYEMGGRFSDPLYVAGVLVSKAWPATREIAVVGNAADLAKLDEQLWAQPQGRFLPHDRGEIEGADPAAGGRTRPGRHPDQPGSGRAPAGRALRAHPRIVPPDSHSSRNCASAGWPGSSGAPSCSIMY
jgi:hypothetical protein